MVKDHMVKIAREETGCCHMGYSFQLAARGLCYTSHGALAGTRNISIDPP